MPTMEELLARSESTDPIQEQPKSLGILTIIARALARNITAPVELAERTGSTLGAALAKVLPLNLKVSPKTKAFAQQIKEEMGKEKLGGLIKGGEFKSVKEAAGTTLEAGLGLASFLPIGGATTAIGKATLGTAVKAGLKGGAKFGAIYGGGFAGAEALKSEKDALDTLEDIAVGAGVGTVVGAALGGVTAGVGFGIKKGIGAVKSFFSRAAEQNPARFVFSVKERLKDMGPEGEEIANRFLETDRSTLLKAANRLDDLVESGVLDLDIKKRQMLVDAAQGVISPDDLPDDVAKAYLAWDTTRRELAGEAVEKGVYTRVKGGEATLFKPRENFFPHQVSISNLKDPKIRTEILTDTIRRGEFTSIDEAEKTLNAYLEYVETNGRKGKFWINYLVNSGKADSTDEARGVTMRLFKRSRLQREGTIEFARELDFPFYDPNPLRVIPKYVLGTTRRLQEIEFLGIGKPGKVSTIPEIDKLLGKLQRTQGREVGVEAKNLVKVVTGAIERNPNSETASRILRTVQTPRLAFSQITNIGQNFNSLLSADTPSFFKGLWAAFTPKGKEISAKSGVVLRPLIQEIESKTGAEGKFGELFLRYTGFELTEKINRRVAANVGAKYAQSLAEDFLNGDKNAAAILNDFGINGQQVIQQGGNLTEKQILRAAQVFTEITQFRSRALDLPTFFQSPFGKVVTQFKSFAFQQAKFLKDNFVQAAKRKDYGKIVRDLVVMGTVFPLGGEVLADIRSLITGSKRPTNLLSRYLSNLAQVGGLGLASDLWSSARRKDLLRAAAGPTISTATKLGEIIVNLDRITDADIRFLINMTGVARPISNLLLPPKERKGFESIFKTLTK